MMTIKIQKPILAAFGILIFLGLVTLATKPLAATVEDVKAVAVLHPTAGNTVSGTIWLTKTSDGTQITADVSGLKPGKHGFHIHQWGDCSAADGTSAGGHYNPFNREHGGPDADMRHIGDLGNLSATGDGTAHYERTDSYVTLDGPNSVIGRAFVLHAGEDDMQSQPTGNAGGRLACGVIGYAK